MELSQKWKGIQQLFIFSSMYELGTPKTQFYRDHRLSVLLRVVPLQIPVPAHPAQATPPVWMSGKSSLVSVPQEPLVQTALSSVRTSTLVRIWQTVIIPRVGVTGVNVGVYSQANTVKMWQNNPAQLGGGVIQCADHAMRTVQEKMGSIQTVTS